MTSIENPHAAGKIHDDSGNDNEAGGVGRIQPGTVRSRLSTFEQPYAVPPDARSGPTKPPRTFTFDPNSSAGAALCAPPGHDSGPGPAAPKSGSFKHDPLALLNHGTGSPPVASAGLGVIAGTGGNTSPQAQFLKNNHRAQQQPADLAVNGGRPTMVLCHPKPVPKKVLQRAKRVGAERAGNMTTTTGAGGSVSRRTGQGMNDGEKQQPPATPARPPRPTSKPPLPPMSDSAIGLPSDSPVDTSVMATSAHSMVNMPTTEILSSSFDNDLNLAQPTDDSNDYAIYDVVSGSVCAAHGGDVSDKQRSVSTRVHFSHDYEQITGTHHKLHHRASSLRRVASDEIIYAKPFRNESLSADANRGSQNMWGLPKNDKIDPPRIYYASSQIVKDELLSNNASSSSSSSGISSRSGSKRLGNSGKLFDKFKKGRLSQTQSTMNLARTPSVKKRRYLDSVTLAMKARNSHIISADFASPRRGSAAFASESDLRSHSNDSSSSNSDRCSPVDLEPDPGLGGNSGVPSRMSSVNSTTSSQRSLILRRTTIMYHENEIAFRARKAPQLFELFAFVGLDLTENCAANGTYVPPTEPQPQYIPVIKYSYPSHRMYKKGSDQANILSNLPFLTFPDYTTVEPVETMHEYYFVVTLTDMCGTRRFAYCCRYLPVDPSATDSSRPVLPAVLVLVSPVHASYFYQELLREAVSRLKVNLQLCITFLKSAFHKPFPHKGDKLSISTGLAGDLVLVNDFAQEHVIADTYRTLEILDVRNLLILFSALLSEKRILLIAGDIETLSTCIQGITCLLYPFKWPHTLIPVVPDCNIELCFAPFPYLMGVLRTNQTNLAKLKQLFKGEDEEFLLILDVDMGIIRNQDIAGINRALPARILKGLRDVMTHLMNDWLPPSQSAATAGGNSQSNASSAHHMTSSCTAIGSGDDSDSPGANSALYREGDELLSELFLLVFVELVGHYRKFTVRQQDGSALLLIDKFIEGHKSKSVQTFLSWFTQMGMFQVWRRQKLDDIDNEDLFDAKIAEVRKIFHGKQTWLKQLTARIRDPFRIM